MLDVARWRGWAIPCRVSGARAWEVVEPLIEKDIKAMVILCECVVL
jgi:hypothetical protein